MSDKAAAKRSVMVAKQQRRIRDRRRFKDSPAPTGETRRLAPAVATGTLFPTRVFMPSDTETVLKDGASNAKIGGDVMVGRLRGAKIFTLTLEERATCPTSCDLWDRCYGNGMQWTKRWRHGPELEAALTTEVADLCAAHDLVLIRLHILGDFYSPAYVTLWFRLLHQHQNLHVFGFTAHGPDTELGGQISAIRGVFPERFAVRHSGHCMPWGSFTIDYPTERKRIGDAIVCPEQLSAMNGADDHRHCGSCAACWSCDSAIVFVEH